MSPLPHQHPSPEFVLAHLAPVSAPCQGLPAGEQGDTV